MPPFLHFYPNGIIMEIVWGSNCSIMTTMFVSVFGAIAYTHG